MNLIELINNEWHGHVGAKKKEEENQHQKKPSSFKQAEREK